MRVIMDEFDHVFLPYGKILDKLKILNIKTKNGKEITHKDLRKAISIMIKKHPTCRWRSEKIRSKRYYSLFEGYLWLVYVYFQSEKKQIDADIDFFKMRIEVLEEKLLDKDNPTNIDDYINNIYYFLQDYNDRYNNVISENEILDLCINSADIN